MSFLHVVLYQPEIPQNTGNIGRTCVALSAKLWIVRPTGFRLDSAQLKRAGMDYWQALDWEVVDSWEHLQNRLDLERIWLITKFGDTVYTDVSYKQGDVLVFGCETNGLPDTIRDRYPQRQLRIPMAEQARSLNLSNAVAIVVYEAARQLSFSHQCALDHSK